MTLQEALSVLRESFNGCAELESAIAAQQARITELEQAVRVRDEALRMLAARTMLIYCMVKEKTGSLSCEDNCHTAYDSSQCIQNRINAALEAAGGENGNGRI